MAKAQLTLPTGAVVAIEGTPEEVADVLARFQTPESRTSGSKKVKKTKASSERATQTRSRRAGSGGPQVLIRELKDSDFFSQRRNLTDVKAELEKGGHIYAVTHLSTPLLRLVRARELRRLKEGDQWTYVNP